MYNDNIIELSIFCKENSKTKFLRTNEYRPAKKGEWYITKAYHSTGLRAIKSVVGMKKRNVNIIIPLDTARESE